MAYWHPLNTPVDSQPKLVGLVWSLVGGYLALSLHSYSEQVI